jgi:hypothetical protein
MIHILTYAAAGISPSPHPDYPYQVQIGGNLPSSNWVTLTEEAYAQLLENYKEQAVVFVAAHTIPPPAAEPHHVLKDTIIQRIKAAGKLSDMAYLVSQLQADQKFEFDHSTWFHSDNPLIVAGIQQLELDPSVILAPDPLAP